MIDYANSNPQAIRMLCVFLLPLVLQCLDLRANPFLERGEWNDFDWCENFYTCHLRPTKEEPSHSQLKGTKTSFEEHFWAYIREISCMGDFFEIGICLEKPKDEDTTIEKAR